MQIKCPNCGSEVQSGVPFCNRCGSQLPKQPAPPVHATAEPVQTPSSGKLFPILTICLSILVVALAVFGFAQYNRCREMERSIRSVGLNVEDLEASMVSLQNENSILEDDLIQAQQLLTKAEETIAQQNQQMDAMEKELDTYHTLTYFLQQYDAGYADTTFHSVRPVYVMHVDDPPATFTLTAKLNGGTIYYGTSGDSAIVSPTEETFYSTTPMQIDPVREGITYITFTNSKNDLSFRVMVLIIE